MKKIREFIPIIFIVLVAAVLRLLWLDRVPGAINGDELHYILTLKSVVLSGHDFTSTWNILPIIFFRYPPGLVQAELPYFLLYPAAALFDTSLTASRAIYALFSAGIVFATYLLAGKLFDRRVALIAAVLSAINPWQVFIGRTAYEVVPATFFYILAIYFLISQKGNKIFISIPIFFLAFYSYIGTKILLVPIVIFVSVFAYLQSNKKYAKQYLAVNVLCFALTLFFAFMVSANGTTRTGEIFTPFSQKVIEQVNTVRKASLTRPQNISEKLINNRFTIYFNNINSRVFDALSFKTTFSETDQFVALYRTGFFYYLDAIFLIIGLLFLFAEKRKVFIFIAGLLALGIVPQVLFISGTYFSPHMALFYGFLTLPIAYGIYKVVSRHKIILAVVTLLYAFSIISFVNMYFFEFPKQGHFDFPARELSNYIRLSSESGKKVDVYVKSPADIYNKYIYYSKSLNKQNIDQIQKSKNTKRYKIGNVSFYSCGDIFKNFNKKATTVYQGEICDQYENDGAVVKITQLADGGEVYRVYGDAICSKYNLNTYPQNIKLSDFSVEDLNTQRFCETFITR